MSIAVLPWHPQRPTGKIVFLGTAYAGEARVAKVEVSTDGGASWQPAECLGPDELFAWHQWQFVWEAPGSGRFTILCRATDRLGRRQPETADWNVLGYGNNGVRDHALTLDVIPPRILTDSPPVSR